MTDPEAMRMVRARATGELADRIFAGECSRLGITSAHAMSAPLLVIAIRLARPQGRA